MLDPLYELTDIANRPGASVRDIVDACHVVVRATAAQDAYVIRAGDPDFVRIGCPCSPRDYEIKQKGYWLLWRDLAAGDGAVIGRFDVEDRIVSGGGVLAAGAPATHIATILPADESNSELLVLRGQWDGGLDATQIRFLTVARTLLSHLVSNVLDTERRERQRGQLASLANVSRAFNEAREADHVLTDVATALAKASGFDWVTIAMFNEGLDGVVDRGMNVARHSSTETATVFREGRITQDRGEVALGVELARRNTKLLITDVSAPEETAARFLGDALPSLQKYWERGHILSIAMLPVVFQGKPLGILHFSSSTRRGFEQAEADFLIALVEQVATALKGVRLYDDLERSRDKLRESEERFRSLVQNSSDLISIIDVDGTFRYTSPSVQRLMGYRPEEWVGASILGFIHPDDLSRATELLASVIDQPGAHPAVVVRTRHNDGSWRYIETTPNNLLDVPSIRGIVFNARDVTERWLAADALRQSEERFRSLVQNASDLITVIDADTMVRYQSPSISRVLGYGPDDVAGRRLSDFLHEDDLAGTLAAIRDAMAKTDVAVAEARMRHRDGSWRDIELIGTDQRQNPAIGGFVLNMRDVSERKSLEQQLRHQALHDPLTKLANRTRFADRLGHALLRAGRTGCRVAVLFMDLDNFKGVNDSLGHGAGDRLLTDVAERIEACLRPGDTVARLGGDEFAILLDEAASVDDAVSVTRRLFEGLQAPFELEGKELLVRASVGIAVSGAGGDATDADALLRDADVAMYVAKSRGKGRFEVFEESMKVSLMERMELLADLQRAVERGEFVLQYQPIFLLKSGELFGMEALVRWQHPTRGLIPPDEFISLAEESGAILELGAWVLREACERARAWQIAYPAEFAWTMSVNVSVKQLQHPSFVAEVAQTLQGSGIEAHRVILEITESVMMHDVPLMMERLRELKRVGVRLAIDDFGTGYSSLSYLREFPFDLLKIDKAFIDDVGAASDQKELTTAIIELGKTLDLELVAEGIERSDQVSRLTTLDCGLGQGFFLAEPLDLGQVESLLSELRDKRDAAA